MFIDCYNTCGVTNSKCKNRYCSANPNYTPPKVKEKPKGGPGKPSNSPRSKIKKDNGYGYNSMFKER